MRIGGEVVIVVNILEEEVLWFEDILGGIVLLVGTGVEEREVMCLLDIVVVVGDNFVVDEGGTDVSVGVVNVDVMLVDRLVQGDMAEDEVAEFMVIPEGFR